MLRMASVADSMAEGEGMGAVYPVISMEVGSVVERELSMEVVMLGVELGLRRRRCAWRRDWPRMGGRKPVVPEEEEAMPGAVELAEEEVGRDLVEWGKEPGRGAECGLEGKGEGDGGYFEEVRGGEIRWAALLWLLVGRGSLAVVVLLLGCVVNGLGIGSVGERMSGGL